MTTNPIPNPEHLKEVEAAFSKYLDESAGQRRHWSEALKLLAVRAVVEGHSPRVVAKAAGVSRGSVVNWCKNEGTQVDNNELSAPVVELKIIKERQQKDVPTEAREDVNVRILFRSGVILECPVSALTAEILSALNEARG